MKKDFIDYIKKEFDFGEQEIKDFELSLKQKVKKSIRINTNKISIEEFRKLANKNNWLLEETSLWKNTFYIDTNNSEINLWNSLEHISWLFYMQEVSASSSPFYLSEDSIDIENNFLILDISASPGWKTTQLCEYYPNSVIIANELDKSRMKQLFSSIDRMSWLNVVSTNYDWRFFKNTSELFDKILIDAPCSWEWTYFKNEDSLKYWNIKNIKKISKLQFWLLESAIISLKIWWELVYSTCTLNKIENEEVIEKALEKYSDTIEIIPISKENKFKRNWPHKDLTGWFFVAKIRKIKSLNLEETEKKSWKEKENFVKQNLEKLTNNEQNIIESFFLNNFGHSLENKFLHKYKSDIFLTNKNINSIWDKLFLFKIWVNIWEIKDQEFIPSFFAWTFEKFEKWIIKVTEEQLDNLYKWTEIQFLSDLENIYYQVVCDEKVAWIVKLKDNKLKSLIPSNLMRK